MRTGIRLIAADGAVVHARTLEFAIDIRSDVIVVARDDARIGSTLDSNEGLTMKGEEVIKPLTLAYSPEIPGANGQG